MKILITIQTKVQNGISFFRNNKLDFLILACIVIFAGILRLYKLADVPKGFHSDEVLNGYIGRFIIENGTDIYGNPYPWKYFNNFGDYPNVIPMYISGISTFILALLLLPFDFQSHYSEF